MKCRTILPGLVAIIACLALAGCRPAPSVRRCSGSVWSTTYSITYIGRDNLDDSILAVMKRVEQSLSPFADSSMISRINRGESAATDSLIRRVFLASQHINLLSHGAFDPTLSPLINLWGFGYRKGSTEDCEPTSRQIDSCLQLVGINRCRLVGDTLLKADPRIEFNFSAITKGYGCDLIGEMLRRNGVTDYMVEIGGEIALSGLNPSGEKWHIQIDDPKAEGVADGAHSRLAVIALTDCGIATSGNYRNYRETAGRRTWHTIDPHTGHPAVTSTLSATVVAPDCMTADALATTCMALPPDSALALISRIPGVSALLVVAPDPSTPSASLRTLRTATFPRPL